MSTGKRLAKRSILGTRVACMSEDGKYYPSIICNVKQMDEGKGPTVYTVRVEGEHRRRDVRESDLVGSGFVNVNSVKLRSGQKVYITHNQREIHGAVLYHRPNIDEVLISIINPETGVKSDVKKRLEEIRLMESRKSARLADSDTDFAKLADMNTERKERKQSQGIDVPIPGSRKRRSSRPEDEEREEGQREEGLKEGLNECSAAMVLMKLSCSPRSPVMPPDGGMGLSESAVSSVSSGVWSWAGGSQSSWSPQHRSATPSPPLSESSPANTDDGLDLDDSFFDETVPRKRRSSTRTMFKCTWVGCQEMTSTSGAIERHVRLQHLGRAERSGTVSEMSENSESDSDSDDDHEEEFYWTEIEVNVATWVDPCEPLGPSPAPVSPPPPPAPPMAFTFTTSPTTAIPTPIAPPQPIFTPTFSSFASPPQYIQVYSPPTLSHMDMARPPHEDPEYQRQFAHSAATLSSSWPRTSAYLSSSSRGKIRVSSSPKSSPGRGKRNGESRKCRKVYGMEQRDMWCTQCKWKKACSRFGE